MEYYRKKRDFIEKHLPDNYKEMEVDELELTQNDRVDDPEKYLNDFQDLKEELFINKYE